MVVANIIANSYVAPGIVIVEHKFDRSRYVQ